MKNETYIALLRGINVGGHKKILMADLRQIFEKRLKLRDVRTYIQSGNIVFRAPSADQSELEVTIKSGILDKFGFDVPVVVRGAVEFETVLRGNPYIERGDCDPKNLYVIFLSDVPEESRVAEIADLKYAEDEFIVSGSAVYVNCPGGAAATKLTNTFFEKKLKVAATARNWRTVNKLVEIARS